MEVVKGGCRVSWAWSMGSTIKLGRERLLLLTLFIPQYCGSHNYPSGSGARAGALVSLSSLHCMSDRLTEAAKAASNALQQAPHRYDNEKDERVSGMLTLPVSITVVWLCLQMRTC